MNPRISATISKNAIDKDAAATKENSLSAAEFALSLEPAFSIEELAKFDELTVLRQQLTRLAESTRNDVESRRRGLRALDKVVPRGLSVVVHLTSCDFVHAASRTAALKAFVAKFGADAPGWVLEHDPISIGSLG